MTLIGPRFGALRMNVEEVKGVLGEQRFQTLQDAMAPMNKIITLAIGRELVYEASTIDSLEYQFNLDTVVTAKKEDDGSGDLLAKVNIGFIPSDSPTGTLPEKPTGIWARNLTPKTVGDIFAHQIKELFHKANRLNTVFDQATNNQYPTY